MLKKTKKGAGECAVNSRDQWNHNNFKQVLSVNILGSFMLLPSKLLTTWITINIITFKDIFTISHQPKVFIRNKNFKTTWLLWDWSRKKWTRHFFSPFVKKWKSVLYKTLFLRIFDYFTEMGYYRFVNFFIFMPTNSYLLCTKQP